MKENESPLTVFEEIKWYRLTTTFICKKNSTQMKSHPISVFQAIVKAVSSKTSAFSALDNRIMPIFHIRDKKHSYKMKPGEQIQVDFFFFKQSPGEISLWRRNLIEYLSEPVYSETVEILTCGEIEERNYRMLSAEFGELPAGGEMCLDFLTPLPFNAGKGKSRVSLSKQKFIALFEKRFSDLFGRSMVYEPGQDDFTVLPYYWRYTEIKHTAKSQPGTIQYINGTVGKLYIKGNWRNFLPFLIVGSEIHTGSKLANSQGYYRLLAEAPPYFADLFPDSKALITVIRDVLENYDHAAEGLSRDEIYPFDEKVFAERLCEEIKNDGYLPTPNTAFVIRQKNKKDRVVEQVNFRDLIVGRYLLKTLYKVFDNIFEEESIGSRRGISRERAIEMVKNAVAEGYEYIIESDIEDFFPSVDLGELRRLLDYYIPSKDAIIKGLLGKLTGNGYVLEGRYHERVKGLALGNPLSPCLANLYLDSFDEYVKSMDVRLVRYVDDFIIFFKSQEQAKAVALKLNIEPVQKVFGSTFFQKGGNLFLKEPLCIDEVGVWVGLRGGMVVIEKGKNILEVKPLRRVSEIEISEDSMVSAGLLRRCKEREIPLSIRLIGGYLFPILEYGEQEKKNIDDGNVFII